MDAFVEFDGEVPGVIIEAALRRAVAAGRLMPLVAGSAKTGVGIDALQEVVKSFIPAETGGQLLRELGYNPVGSVGSSPQAPFLGWAYGIRGKGSQLLEVRVLEGTICAGHPLKEPESGSTFAPSKLWQHGPQGQLIDCATAGPGDIVLVPMPAALDGKFTSEGIVLSDSKRPFKPRTPPSIVAEEARVYDAARRRQCTFVLQTDSMDKTKRNKLMQALEVVLQDDDGLLIEEDERTGEKLFSCMGMLHLELIRERLAEEFRIYDIPLGQPKVGYLATVRTPSKATGTHNSGGKTRIRKGIVHEHIGHVDAWAKIEISPAVRGSGVEIDDTTTQTIQSGDTKITREAVQGLKHGVRLGLETAGPGGIPVTDVQVRFLGAEAQKEDAAIAAAVSAVKSALEASPQVALLEPIVELNVDVPETAVDDVQKDLEKRRGEVWGTRPSEGTAQIVEVHVPMREIADYTKDLSNITEGEGFFEFGPVSYREVTMSLEQQILDSELSTPPKTKAVKS